MLTLIFLIKTLIDTYIIVLLLRIWMQCTNCDFYNPFSQFIVKITYPLIRPLSRFIPTFGSLDGSIILLEFFLATIKFPLLILIEMHVFVFDPIYLLIGLLVIFKAAGELIFWMMIIRSFLSWINKGYNEMDAMIYQLSEPLMDRIRRMLPINGIDLSAMVIVLIIYALNYLGMDLFPKIWYRL